MSRKSLLVFCDGTGQDGTIVDPHYLPGGKNEYTGKKPSNILKLSRSAYSTRKDSSGNVINQIVFYQSGTASLTNFDGKTITEDDTLKAYGVAVANKVREAYAFISQNYAPGDDIYLFGFSRGAYTARKVAGLIDRIGLLDRKELSKFFTYWLALYRGDKPGPPRPASAIPIKLVAVFDTVGSIMTRTLIPHPIPDLLSIKDNILPPNIAVALHAISLQENRAPFPCTLWKIPDAGLASGQVLKQRIFPGAHSDVGGGYVNHELADVALFWMAAEIQSLSDVALDMEYIAQCREPVTTAVWGYHQPHNAWMEWGKTRYLPGCGHQTRLESGNITPDAEFHLSIKFSTPTLDVPSYMITIDDVQTEFRKKTPGWEPDCKPLLDWETERKKHWGDKLVSTPNNGAIGDMDSAEGFIRSTVGSLEAVEPSAFKGAFPAGIYWIRSSGLGTVLGWEYVVWSTHLRQTMNKRFVKDNTSIKWALEPGLLGYCIKHVLSGQYVGFQDNLASHKAGDHVYLGEAAEWHLTGSNGKIQLRPVLEPSFRVVSSTDGKHLSQVALDDSTAQNKYANWEFNNVATTVLYKDDVSMDPRYWIRSAYGNRTLSILRSYSSSLTGDGFNGIGYQKWILEQDFKGYNVKNAAFSLDMGSASNASSGESIAPGIDISDKWKFAYIADGQYSITAANWPGLALSIDKDSTDYNAIYSKIDDTLTTQRWFLTDSSKKILYIGDVDPGTYRIRNVCSKKALDLSGSKTGNEVINYDPSDSSKNQKWTLSQDFDGYTFQNGAASDAYLGFHKKHEPKSGDQVYGDFAWQWKVTKTSDGNYEILLACKPSLALDLKESKKDNGTPIILYTKNDGDNQKWTFTKV